MRWWSLVLVLGLVVLLCGHEADGVSSRRSTGHRSSSSSSGSPWSSPTKSRRGSHGSGLKSSSARSGSWSSSTGFSLNTGSSSLGRSSGAHSPNSRQSTSRSRSSSPSDLSRRLDYSSGYGSSSRIDSLGGFGSPSLSSRSRRTSSRQDSSSSRRSTLQSIQKSLSSTRRRSLSSSERRSLSSSDRRSLSLPRRRSSSDSDGKSSSSISSRESSSSNRGQTDASQRQPLSSASTDGNNESGLKDGSKIRGPSSLGMSGPLGSSSFSPWSAYRINCNRIKRSPMDKRTPICKSTNIDAKKKKISNEHSLINSDETRSDNPKIVKNTSTLSNVEKSHPIEHEKIFVKESLYEKFTKAFYNRHIIHSRNPEAIKNRYKKSHDAPGFSLHERRNKLNSNLLKKDALNLTKDENREDLGNQMIGGGLQKVWISKRPVNYVDVSFPDTRNQKIIPNKGYAVFMSAVNDTKIQHLQGFITPSQMAGIRKSFRNDDMTRRETQEQKRMTIIWFAALNFWEKREKLKNDRRSGG